MFYKRIDASNGRLRDARGKFVEPVANRANSRPEQCSRFTFQYSVPLKRKSIVLVSSDELSEATNGSWQYSIDDRETVDGEKEESRAPKRQKYRGGAFNFQYPMKVREKASRMLNQKARASSLQYPFPLS